MTLLTLMASEPGVPDLVSFSTVAGINTALFAIEFIVIDSYTCSEGSLKWAGLQLACAAAWLLAI
jgi:hypothetical protein